MNLAIITARSGSKGLINKNIKILNGKPLLAYAIEAANNSNCFDEVMVSTDSVEYANIASEYGAKVPFLRSEYSSSDTASTRDCIVEVLSMYKNQEKYFDKFMILQPTSPLRDYKDIKNAFDLYKKKNAKSVISVVQLEHPLQWCNTLEDNLSLNNFLDISDDRRQNCLEYYRINGAIYLHDSLYYLENDNIFDSTAYALIMDKKHSIDIDTLYDFEIAEFLLKKGEKI